MGRCCSRKVRSSRLSPLQLGAANGVTVRCRVLVPFRGMKVYDVHYFTGDGVQDRLDSGALRIV